MKKLTTTEIAARINDHLKRFERDPKINVDESPSKTGLHPYFHAGAHRSGARVGIRYITYQGTSYVTTEQARAYLAWLDAGNVGRHFEQQRESAKEDT